MAWEWLAPSAIAAGAAASFIGARVGARANRDASAEATTQRDLQARREEWGRRFTTALDRTGSDDVVQQEMALVMLDTLLQSSLADDDDRRVARAVYAAFVEWPDGIVATDLDDAVVIVDDEAEDLGGEQP